MTLSNDTGGRAALEDAVRNMLHGRAEQVTISPNAWIRTTARAGRSRRAIGFRGLRVPGRRFQSWLVPLTAAVAVLAIGIATALVASTGDWRTLVTSASRLLNSSPSPVPALAPVCDSRVQGKQTIPTDPETSGTVTFETWPGQQPTRLKQMMGGLQTAWLQQAAGSTLMCVADSGRTSGGTPSDTNWTAVPQLTSARPAAFFRIEFLPADLVPGTMKGAEYQTPEGVALRSVASVAAVTSTGHRVQGTVMPVPGTPYVIWWLSYAGAEAPTLTFRTAAGQVLSHLNWAFPGSRTAAPASEATPGQPIASVGTWQQTTYGKVWTTFRFSRIAGSLRLSVEQTGNSAGGGGFSIGAAIPAGQVARFVDSWGDPDSVMPLYGSAEQAVTTVTADLPDGRTYQGTVLDAAGFPYKAWTVTYPTKYPATLKFGDAQGHVLGQLSEPANPHAPGPQGPSGVLPSRRGRRPGARPRRVIESQADRLS